MLVSGKSGGWGALEIRQEDLELLNILQLISERHTKKSAAEMPRELLLNINRLSILLM